MFYFHPYLGKWSNLTIIFFKGVGGWNHQADYIGLVGHANAACYLRALGHRNPSVFFSLDVVLLFRYPTARDCIIVGQAQDPGPGVVIFHSKFVQEGMEHHQVVFFGKIHPIWSMSSGEASNLFCLNQIFFGEENIVITKIYTTIFLFFSSVGPRETEKTTKRLSRLSVLKILNFWIYLA